VVRIAKSVSCFTFKDLVSKTRWELRKTAHIDLWLYACVCVCVRERERGGEEGGEEGESMKSHLKKEHVKTLIFPVSFVTITPFSRI
jgi:hypothetical protein